MPMPIWIVKFWEEHGRDPRPDEIPLDVRRVLLGCVRENEERGQPASSIERQREMLALRPVP